MNPEIKKEVLNLVQEIDDENLLQLIKAEIEDYKEVGTDVTDSLIPEHFEELKNQAAEDPFKDIISEEEYHSFLSKWRTK